MGNVINAIKNRRSIRSYSLQKPSREDLVKILEAARWAPSGKNGQPWKFIVIMDNEELKDKISSLTAYRRWVEKAPCLIAVYLDTAASYDRIKDIQAVGAAIQNILLAAYESGLGTCWIGEILRNSEKVNEVLEVPDSYELMAVITVGYADIIPSSGSRKDADEIIVWT